mgnify:CR=1 FL=1
MSDKPVLVVTRKLPTVVEERLQRDYHPKLNPNDRLYSSDELVGLCDGASGMMPCHTEQLTAEVIARLPASIKIIANFSVGVDHCDLDAARKRGITVTNTPDVLTEATADLTLALVLAVARRLPEAERFLRNGKWERWEIDLLCGSDVHGATLGIVGFGRIGRAVARRACCRSHAMK